MRWPAIRIDRHDGTHARLLAEAVAPLLPELRAAAGVGDDGLLARAHWARGAHLLLAFDAPAGRVRDAALPLVRARVGAWLAANPGAPAPHPPALAVRLAAAEGIAPPAGPPLPDNGITAAAHDLPPPLGLPALGDARNRFHARALPRLAALAATRIASRAAAALDAAGMIAAIDALPHAATMAFWPVSLLAHVEVFLAGNPALRPQVEANAAKLVPALADRWNRAGGHAADPAAGAAWRAALAGFDDAQRPLATDALAAAAMRAFVGPGGVPPAMALPAAFGDGTSFTPALAAPAHLRFRLLVNGIYAALPLAGLTPLDRVLACALVWRTLEAHAPARLDAARAALRALLPPAAAAAA